MEKAESFGHLLRETMIPMSVAQDYTCTAVYYLDEALFDKWWRLVGHFRQRFMITGRYSSQVVLARLKSQSQASLMKIMV